MLAMLSEKFRVRESRVGVCRLCNIHGSKNWQTLRLPDQCCHLLQLICKEDFCSLLWWCRGWGAVFGDDRCSTMFIDFYDLLTVSSAAFVEHDSDRLVTEPVDSWDCSYCLMLFPLNAYTELLWEFFVTAYYVHPSAVSCTMSWVRIQGYEPPPLLQDGWSCWMSNCT